MLGLLLFFSNNEVFSKIDAYVRLTTNDCAFCYSSLYLLNNFGEDCNVICILKNELQEEGNEIFKNKFNVDLNKFRVIYSDSIYNLFTVEDESYTSIFFTINSKVVYNCNLKELPKNLERVFAFIQAMRNENTDTITFDTKIASNIHPYFSNDKYLIFESNFNKFVVFDKQGSSLFQYKLNDSIVKSIYEDKFKDNSVMYNSICTLQKTGTIGIMPVIDNLYFHNDTIDLLLTLYTFKINPLNKEDTIIFPFMYIQRIINESNVKLFNIKIDFDSAYYIDGLSSFYYLNSNYYFSLNKINAMHFETNYTIAEFIINKNNLVFNHFMNTSLPDLYLKNNLNYNLSNRGITYPYIYFRCSGDIYNLNTNEHFNPFILDSITNLFISKLSLRPPLKFIINDMKIVNNKIKIIYLKGTDLYQADYEMNTFKLIKESILISTSQTASLRLFPFVFGPKVGYLPKSCNCIILK